MTSVTRFSQIPVGQKQPPRGVLKKRCSDNMQQIFRRKLMPRCDFNKVVKQLMFFTKT